MWKRNNDNNDLKERRVNTEIEGLKAENASLTLMNEMYKKKIDELNTLIKQISEQFVIVKRERDMLKARHECLIGINDELTENLEEYKQLYDYARQGMDTIMVAGTLYHNKRENDLIDKNKELVKKNNDLRKNLEEALRHVDELKRTLYTRSHELAAARLANDDLKEKASKLTDPALKHENEVLENTIIKLNREKMDLLERLDDRDGEIHDLKEKIIRLEQVIEGCNSRIRTAFDHALELEQEKAHYKRQIDLVNASMKDLIEKLQAEKK